MEPVARFFLCARCRCQVLICSHCDRGQRYCNGHCAGQARRDKQKEASQRYQKSRQGRIKHSIRASHYRARRNKVTHHSSPEPVSNDLLIIEDSAATKSPVTPPVSQDIQADWRCHWCGCRCQESVRYGFMGRFRVPDQINPLLTHQRNLQ